MNQTPSPAESPNPITPSDTAQEKRGWAAMLPPEEWVEFPMDDKQYEIVKSFCSKLNTTPEEAAGHFLRRVVEERASLLARFADGVPGEKIISDFADEVIREALLKRYAPDEKEDCP